MSEENLTPNVHITPDPNSPEAKFFENEATENNEATGTEVKESTPKEPSVDYKEKFSASTRENQRILAENKAFQEKMRETEQRLSALEQEKIEIETRLREEQPETYDAITTKKELAQIKRDLVLQKEKIAIDEYVNSNPEAKSHKEALKTLGRANPNMSYDELYNRHIKPIYEAGAKDYEAKIKLNKQSQPETGRDSVDKGPVQTNDLKEFNSLPLEERRRRLKAQGL